ncbi:MAG: LamG-like jellyroll fold domain-containing protein, partial [Bacteroidota bacterium]
MNTPKLIHARGSLLLKIINSAQSDSYDNRYLAFKVQTNRILFRSPEDGNAWSDLQSLMKRWYKKPEGSKIIVEGQITLDALPASPFPAFYGLSLEYSPKEVVMSIEQQEAFGEGSNLSFSNLHLQFFDRPDQPAIGLEGSVNMSYRGAEPLLLHAQITDEGMAFIADGESLDQFQVNHPFLNAFVCNKLEVKSHVQRWENLETQFTFGETGGNLIYDYAGTGEELNLRVRNRKQVKWTDKGLQLLVQHDDYKKNPKITSERSSRRLVESIKNSGEMSVEIWMKSANLKQIGPAELLSLEKNERRRNFALGQGPEGKPNKNKAKLPNGSFLNARISASATDRDGEPGIQSPLNSLVLDTTHVVFTRDSSGKTALYLNGTCCAEGKANGSLEDWEDDLNLIIGNDTRFSGPWEGELYHLSIYSKALSEKEVHAHFSPQLYVEGKAHLAKVPAPLTSPLDAKWHIQPESSEMAVHGFGREVANQLRFENIDMKLHIDGAGKMKPTGDIRTSLWGNEFLMAVSRKGGQNSPWPNLKMHDPGITAYLEFGQFARVSMQSFSLLAGKSSSDQQSLTWHMEEVGGVFINDFPDVVDGISKIDLKLEGQGVNMDIVEHNHSFTFLQNLNLRFRNEEVSAGFGNLLMGPIRVEDQFSQWAVTPFDQYKIGFLVKQFGIEFPPEVTNDPLNDEKTISQFFGVWNPHKEVRMYLGA